MAKSLDHLMIYIADGNLCVDLYEGSVCSLIVRAPFKRVNGTTFQALGQTFIIHATPEKFSVMPTEIKLPSEVYD